MPTDSDVEGVPVEQRPGLLRINPSPEDVALSTPRPVPMTPDLADLAAAQASGGRWAPLGKIAADYFRPFGQLRNPDTPEARQAYDEALQRAHQAGGGKVPQAPGSPMFNSPEAAALDMLANFGVKGLGAAKGLGALATKGAAAIHPAWISQRFPTAAKPLENPFTERLRVSMQDMQKDPALMPKVAARVREYPNLTEAEKSGTDEEVAENFKNHIVQNLLWMFDRIPKNIRGRSAQWYEGANRMAREAADQYGVPMQTAAAVFAALSPQKDWYENASLAKRVLDTYSRRQNEPFSGAMLKTAQRIYPDEPELISRISNRRKRLGQLSDPEDIAAWIRTWDQTENDPSHRVILPEGTYGDWQKTDAGRNARVAWTSNPIIGKAVGAMQSGGDINTISDLMGRAHKVRNFYNNILDPLSPMRDVTVDTHAVAAGLLRPLAGHDREVVHNLSGPPKSAGTGLRGTYPIFADAYREAARQRRVQPRQMQSITWEGGRGLFSEAFKHDAANKELIERLWRERGSAGIRELQDYIHELAGGIDPPPWY